MAAIDGIIIITVIVYKLINWKLDEIQDVDSITREATVYEPDVNQGKQMLRVCTYHTKKVEVD